MKEELWKKSLKEIDQKRPSTFTGLPHRRIKMCRIELFVDHLNKKRLNALKRAAFRAGSHAVNRWIAKLKWGETKWWMKHACVCVNT